MERAGWKRASPGACPAGAAAGQRRGPVARCPPRRGPCPPRGFPRADAELALRPGFPLYFAKEGWEKTPEKMDAGKAGTKTSRQGKLLPAGLLGAALFCGPVAAYRRD